MFSDPYVLVRVITAADNEVERVQTKKKRKVEASISDEERLRRRKPAIWVT